MASHAVLFLLYMLPDFLFQPAASIFGYVFISFQNQLHHEKYEFIVTVVSYEAWINTTLKFLFFTLFE
jgi:hypothetical protein